MVRLESSESRAVMACSTDSRISFTPPNTALMDKNCASNESAIKRAMVVLPTPGGPHKMQLCGWPDSNATLSAMPSPNKCRWPMTSPSVRGRRRSARGMWVEDTLQRAWIDRGPECSEGPALALQHGRGPGWARVHAQGRMTLTPLGGKKLNCAAPRLTGLISKRSKLSTERWPMASKISSLPRLTCVPSARSPKRTD